jgi:hypothetical protein
MSQLSKWAARAVIGSVAVRALGALLVAQATAPADKSVPFKSTMANPYRLVENWPKLGSIPPGPAIGIIPDEKGGVWLLHRSDPPLLHIDGAGDVVKTMAEGVFGTVHAFCRDRDGNFWAGDSGPFNAANPEAVKKAYVVHKFSPEGKRLLTIGKAGVQKSGEDTFIGPAACIGAPNGDVIIADGHHPRPLSVEGDRLVRYSKDGKFIRAYGKQGTAPGEFMGPHSLAYDSQGRLFVADRSNNRIQIFDKDMNFVDEWRQFGRPSGVAILRDDTLVVADSESSYANFRPSELGVPGPEVRNVPRNAGWQPGIRIGSAKDGSLRYFIPATRPEGMGADDQGAIFGGLTGQCSSAGADKPTPGGPNCLQKWVKK